MLQDELCSKSLIEVAQKVRAKEVSPLDLTQACLEKIERGDGLINSFISVSAEEAIEQARVAEREIVHGNWRGPLHGIPVSLKDLFDQKGKLTTAASAVLLDNVATDDASAVGHLCQSGAILIGKTNLHEFAYGGSGVISHFRAVRNPRDPNRITGGSSSGSAAAVAAGFCFASLGTDTAGSIRLPAACCGIVGLKPAYGRVSAQGVIPLSWSYDHVGPLTRTVEDAFLVLEAVSNWRPRHINVSDLRIGIARNYFFDAVDPGINSALEDAISHFHRHCRLVRDVVVPVDEDRTVFASEAWKFHQKWVQQAPHLYQPQTLQRIRTGEHYSEEEVERSYQELKHHRSSVRDLFREVDVIVTPTTPLLPPTFAEIQKNPETLRPKELLLLRNTRPWNVYGIPALSIPCAPMMGIQLAALDESILRAAATVLT